MLLLFLTVNSVFGDEPCGKPADIAFVIDSSSSIWGPHFDIQVQFVQELVKKFDIGPNTTHVAALTFSDKVATEFYFNEVETAEKAVAEVAKIAHKNGKSTLTHDALHAMRLDLFSPSNGARINVPKIGILLTDGKSTYSSKTKEEARLAKESGIKILAIGIGFKVNDDELEAVVSPPAEDNYFHKSSFDDLKSVMFQELIGQTACKVIETTTTTTTTTTEPTTTKTTTITTTTTTTTEPTTTPIVTTSFGTIMPADEAQKTCQGKEADVIFVVDMSSSIWVEHFKDQLRFLSDLIGNFDINSGKTRIGMVMFSDEAKVQFYLDEYKSQEEISKAILAVKSEGGITNTHLALEKLTDEMLSRKHGARSGVAHICILITDGRSSKPELTLPQAEIVHKSGIYIFAIGVGNMTDASELRMMASKPEYAFDVNGYKALKQIQNLLAYKTCEVPQGDRPPCSNSLQADIMFGMYGIGGGDRSQVTEFIQALGGAFGLESGNVRLGLSESCGKATFKLSEFEDSDDFRSAVNTAMETEMSSLLANIRRSFTPKQDTDKIVILIVSGSIQDIDSAYAEAKRLKFNTGIIVIGVGEGVDKEQLIRLASYKDSFKEDDSHVFTVDESEDLVDLIKKIHVLMCSAQ